MADKLADLSPEEKEKRVAEMKAKMQASAQEDQGGYWVRVAAKQEAPAAAPAAAAPRPC